MSAEVTVAGLKEREFLQAIEEQLREGDADAAAATLRSLLPEVAGDGLPLPAEFLAATAADLVIDGWEMFSDRLMVHDRPQRPITAISIDISWPGHLAVEPDDHGMLDPIIETSYFSDDAFPFSQSDRAQILAGYADGVSKWHGAYEQIDDTIEVRGIAHLYGAVVNLENRIARSPDVTEQERLAHLLASTYVAILLHQAVRDIALRRCLPRPLAVFVGSNEAYPCFDAPVITARTPNTEVEAVEIAYTDLDATLAAANSELVDAEPVEGEGESAPTDEAAAETDGMTGTASIDDAADEAAPPPTETKAKPIRKPRKTKASAAPKPAEAKPTASKSRVSAATTPAAEPRSVDGAAKPGPGLANDAVSASSDVAPSCDTSPVLPVEPTSADADGPFRIAAWEIQPDADSRSATSDARPAPDDPAEADFATDTTSVEDEAADADAAPSAPDESSFASLLSLANTNRSNTNADFDSFASPYPEPSSIDWDSANDEPAVKSPRVQSAGDFNPAALGFGGHGPSSVDDTAPLSSFSLLPPSPPETGTELLDQSWAANALDDSSAHDPLNENLHLPPPDIHITGKQLRARFANSEPDPETQAPRPSFLGRLLRRK